MNNRDETQILGALPLSFGQACINYKILIGEETQFLEQIKADKWYPLDKVLKILNIIEEKYSDPMPIFEQIGFAMMDLWYSRGPGKEIIEKGIDFLHFQTSSEGYYSVIRGKPEQIGDFSLLNIDVEKGTATIHSTTPFNRNMERGVLLGGLSTTKDLYYIDIDNSENEDIFHIQFKGLEQVDTIPIGFPDSVDTNTLYWKYKMLESEAKRRNKFWNSTNESLTKAFEKLGDQDLELQDRTKELLQANTQLYKEINERKRAQKRIEGLNQLKEDLFGPKRLDEKLKSITYGIVSIFDADFARIWITGPGDLCESGCLHANVREGPHVCNNRDLCLKLIASSGRYTHIDGKTHRRVPFGSYKIGRIASDEEGKFIINDISNDPRVHNQEWAKALGLKSFCGYPLNSSHGKPIGVMAIFSKHTITREDDGLLEGLAHTTAQVIQMDTAVNALRDSESELRALFKGMPDVIIKLNRDGTYLKIAPSSPELLYKPEEELRGRNLHETFPKEQADLFLDHIRKSIDTQELVKMEYRLNIANTEHWFDGSIVPMSEDTVIFVARDITDRKFAYKELSENEKRYRMLFELSPTGLLLEDLNGNILDVNPSFCESTGYAKEELLGEHVSILVHPDALSEIEENINLLKNGRVMRHHEKSLRKDGSVCYMDLHELKVQLQEGKEGILCIAVDITERKRAEVELRNAKEVAEEAQIEAEAANRAKSAFLANMSHELRTPLNSILGYTQILKRDRSLKKQQMDAIDTIHYSSEHLFTLINELLDLSRIEAQRMELEVSDVYLPGFFKGITEIASIRAKQEKVPFSNEISADLPTGVRIDEKRLRQVLLNLINNAIKFAGGGNVILRVNAEKIKAKRKKAQTIKIHCEVEDTGIGISPDQINKIFLPFHQAPNRKPAAEGTGLGLPISQNLLHIMGSKLEVKSKQGEGTTFWFDLELPVVKGIKKGEDFTTFGQSKHVIGYKGRKRKVLLVDDNIKNRAVLKDMLLPFGFEVVEARDGKDGFAKAKKVAPDIIFMDLIMPVMDGIEATQKIRKNPELKNIVIVGISASAFDTTKETSFKAGCNDFLTKPIHIENLLNCIGDLLKLKWEYDETTASESTEKKLDPSLPLIIPTKKDLQTLLEFAEISHVTGIQQAIEKIKKHDAKYVPFLSVIEELVGNFLFKDVVEMLQSYIAKEES